MGGDITYMTGAQLQSAIQAANQAVSGMTYAEAVAATGGVAQGNAGGLSQVITFPLLNSEGGQSVTLEAQYAAQMWEYWKTVGAATGTTALGAAAGAAVSWAQGVLIGTGEGLAATAGLLTLSVPTAVAMAAPLLGVGLGVALYESNPTLWNNIAEGLTDFVTEGTQTVKALIDEAGHVLIDSAFVQKLKQIFEENDIPIGHPESSQYISSLFPNGITGGPEKYTKTTVSGTGQNAYYYETISTGAMYYCAQNPANNDLITITASSDPNAISTTEISGRYASSDEEFEHRVEASALNSSYEYDNRTVYYRVGTGIGQTYQEIIPGGQYINADAGAIAWTLVYGEAVEPQEYPEGMNIWNNPLWQPSSDPLTNLPTYPVYNPDAGTTQPYYPITPYVGDNPGTSVDPFTTPQQNPTTPIAPEEWPVIEPYLPPIVNPEKQYPDPDSAPEIIIPPPDELVNPVVKTDPIAIPVPDLNPKNDPSLDPWLDPATTPQENPVTNLDPAQSTGDSPPIVFPIPGVPFPSIVPAGSDTPLEPGVSGQAGFIQVYNPTTDQFIAFGRWLWVTYADATLETIWNNPFDGVIGAHELYATPSKDGYSTIRSGFLDSGIGSIIVRQRYTQINCGSMVIPEYWGNYLDYSPYSKAYIYLPFIGIMEVDVDDIVGHAVNITYHVDSYTGSCIAQITCAKDNYTNTLYQFSGNCAVEIPMSGGSQAQIKAAMMTANAYQNAAMASANASLVGGIGSGLASILGGAVSLAGSVTGTGGVGQIAGGVASIASGVANANANRAYGQAQHTAQMLSGKSNVQHSGSFGSSHGAMGIKKPYIFIRRPIQKVVNNYNLLYGFPAHKQVVIGNCEGFLRCREVHVVSSIATDEEKRLIEQLLTTGVYVTE